VNQQCFEIEVGDDFQLRPTFRLAAMGSRDLTCRVTDEQIEQTFVTPQGPAILSAVVANGIADCTVQGDGAEYLVPGMANYFGASDSVVGFAPTGKMERLAKQFAGTRLPRSPVLFHRLVQIVLQQLVSWDDAAATWKSLVRTYGTPVADCAQFSSVQDSELFIAPEPKRIAELGYYDLVACGAIPKQARLILHLAKQAGRIERLSADPPKLIRFLEQIRGIGPWSIACLRGFVLGEPDVLITGDYGMPHYVSWFLEKKPRSDDAEMEVLLSPFAGHRFRVLHMIMQSGIKPPRYGPKMRSNRWKNKPW
jgi:3-methyladenine DNA glycosylase/8-oxoguanine DNA glycosylase